MTAVLLENFDLLASSLGGVAKLRELILSLAVRGQLVAQNADDESACVLLQRIRTEKDRLVAEGKIKRDKPLSPIGEDEKPHDLPEGWQYVRLANLVTVLNGRAYKQHELLEEGVPVLRVGNLFTSSHWYYSNLELEDDKYCEEGDLLFAWSASFGPFIWPGPTAIYHYHIWKLRLHSEANLDKRFLYTFLQEKTQELKAAGHGVSMVHMTKDSMEKTLVPLPPLAEQSRIVAKVEELMALCDRLEAEQGNAKRVQGHWVQVALDQLSESSDADEFRRNWQHLASHFDTLFTTPESITALEAILLQLAVRGKLVPQDPSDQPASELLKQIRTEKDRLIAEGKIKRDKPLLSITEDEKPYALPAGWEWARFSEVILASDAGWSPSCESTPREGDNWGVLKVSAVTWGEFQPEENKALPVHLEPRPECEVQAGDFLLSRANTEQLVARSVIAWQPPAKLMLSDKLIRLRLSELVNKKLFSFINNSTASRAHYIAKASGTSSSMKNIGREVILSLPVPVPPEAEQSRIVAQVEKLLALTADLRTRLSTAQQVSNRLLNVAIDAALNPRSAEIIAFPGPAEREARRIAIGCYAIGKLASKPYFGRTAEMKLLYLVETYVGLELGLEPERKAAGPFDPWIYDFEKQATENGWFTTRESENGGKVTYFPGAGLKLQTKKATTLFSAMPRKELDRLLDLFADKTTEEAEIIATLFAAWNDFLIDGQQPSDEKIITEVRENWHPKKQRFEPKTLQKWLGWMRKNDLIPQGRGPHTIHQTRLQLN